MDPNNPDKNKLKIKLKFQSKKPTTPFVDDKGKTRVEVEHEAEPEEVLNTNKRVCPHCSKEFSNGKALGGHLRIHAVEKDYKSSLAKKQKFGVGSSSGNREFWCNICHRRYHSEKALYGHMRSHPDRKYRGMEPPNGFVTDDEDEDEDEDNDGGVRELRWKVTGKRKQKVMDSTMEVGSSSFEAAATELMLYMANSASLSKDEDEDEDENEGDFMKKVKRLVKEKLGKKKKEEKKSGIIKEKLEEIEGILKEQGLKIEEFDEDELYFLQDDLGISSVFADDCYYNSDSSLGSWNNNDEENFVVRSRKSDEKEKKKKDKKKRKRVSSFEPGFEPNKKHHKKDDGDDDGGGGNDNVDSPKPVTQLDWPCYTCGKVFNSHQALGGHRSSHNKKNNSKSSLALTLAQDPIQGGQVQIDQGSGLTDLGPGSRSGSGEVKSVIEVGESSSWSPPVQQVQTSSTSFESSPSAQTSSGQRDPVPYMIDLNVSLMDEEEGEW